MVVGCCIDVLWTHIRSEQHLDSDGEDYCILGVVINLGMPYCVSIESSPLFRFDSTCHKLIPLHYFVFDDRVIDTRNVNNVRLFVISGICYFSAWAASVSSYRPTEIVV